MSAAESASQVVSFSTVLDAELEAIELRRERSRSQDFLTAPLQISKDESPLDRARQRDLVGLALSGGGVRSASVCLGVLQAIHRRGILPFIDYLSTVSGGGYAGAYLSSLSTDASAPQSATNGKMPSNSIESRLDGALGTKSTTVQPERGTGKAGQPKAIQKLISNGGFLLKKSLTAINGTLIGILFIWTLVGSGLIAAASLAAYLYRSLDAVPCRQFLAVLGISDQLSLDLFPPLVMFLIYLVIWALTYWRSGSGTTAPMARWWLAATVIVSLVAVATLMGSGNITSDSVAGLIGKGPSDWVGRIFSRLSNVIYPLIIAGLIPFFAPQKLFRSGGADQPGIQSFLFTVACWALLCGVPFLLVAYFTSEGIGTVPGQDDDRLRLSQIKNWEKVPSAPLWTSLTEIQSNSDKNSNYVERLSSHPSLAQVHNWLDRGKFDVSAEASEDATRSESPPPRETAGLFTQLTSHYGNIAKYEFQKDTPLEKVIPGNGWTSPSYRLGVFQRWYHLIEYSLGCLFQLDALDEYQFAKILKEHQDIHDLKERIVFRMNMLLLRPDFYKYFPQDMKGVSLPTGTIIDPKLLGPGQTLSRYEDDWRTSVQRLIDEAKGLEGNNSKSNYRSLVLPINGGQTDTPWFVELRPRWALLPASVEEEVSTDRRVLAESRIREEQSFYPNDQYAAGLVMTLKEYDDVYERRRRESYEEKFPHAISPLLRPRLLAAQSDSFYTVKRWRQVEGFPELSDFTTKLTSNKFIGVSDKDRLFPARAEWSVLDSEFWKQLPWGNQTPTEVREVDRDLQQILASQSFKMRRVLQVNRQLLEAYFPGTIEPMDGRLSSYMVLERDQAARWGWFCCSLVIFLIVGLLLDLNFSSWHGFYAERIGSTWVNPAAGLGSQIPLAQLRNTDVGLPYHLISGSLNPFGRLVRDHSATDLFLLSQLFAGSTRHGYRRVSELRDPNYNLASAVAISGGAVSPLNVKNPLQRVLLLLVNIRLGRWIENPCFCGNRWKILQWFCHNFVISPFRFLVGWFLPLRNRTYCFVTDGGLTENLGIKPLLDRRCKLIISIDAGQDGRFQFHDLSKLMRWIQVDDGIRLSWIKEQTKFPEDLLKRANDLKLQPLHWTPVMPTGVSQAEASTSGSTDPYGRPLNPDADRHYLIARIEYPGYDECPHDNTGYLVYIKNTVCLSDPEELINYQKANPLFPHDPTSDLNFSPDQFESYRRLGEHSLESTVDAIFKDRKQINRGTLIDGVRRAFGGRQAAPSDLGPNEADKKTSKPTANSDDVEWLKSVVRTGPTDPVLCERVFAARELVALGKSHADVVKELVDQLDQGKDVGAVLHAFHKTAVEQLTAGFQEASEAAKKRRVVVLGELLPHSRVALKTLLKTERSEPIKLAINDALIRVPL